MNVEFTAEQHALRMELREYFRQMMTPELIEESEETAGEGGGPLWRAALEQMGRDGWIGIGWSKELGGKGLTPLEQYIFIEKYSGQDTHFRF